jgi:hypothetical protein
MLVDRLVLDDVALRPLHPGFAAARANDRRARELTNH